jgi:hypothetical protein
MRMTAASRVTDWHGGAAAYGLVGPKQFTAIDLEGTADDHAPGIFGRASPDQLRPRTVLRHRQPVLTGVDAGKLAAHLWARERIFVTPIKHEEFEGIRVTPNLYTTLNEIDTFSQGDRRRAGEGDSRVLRRSLLPPAHPQARLLSPNFLVDSLRVRKLRSRALLTN